MTTVYYVRHAEPNHSNHNDLLRELTPKGLKDRELVTDFLADKQIDAVLSSPYKRAVDTVQGIADACHKEIIQIDDFRERRIGNEWIEGFDAFTQRQWEDFNYKLVDGESLMEVQERNIQALSRILDEYENQCVVIGGHGTALSTIIHFYDHTFCYESFREIVGKMPWCVRFTFEGHTCTDIHTYDLL